MPKVMEDKVQVKWIIQLAVMVVFLNTSGEK